MFRLCAVRVGQLAESSATVLARSSLVNGQLDLLMLLAQ